MSLVQDIPMSPPAKAVAFEASKPRWLLLKRILSQPKGAIGLTLVVLYLLLAIFGPWLAPQDGFRQNFAQTLRPPSATHWFGTDQLGRDVFSRVLIGARVTLGIGVGGVAVAFLIGVPLGILAAWRRGWIEAALMRVIDVMLSFPDIVFALAVVAILGANTQNVIFAVGIVAVPVFARTARAVTLSVLAEPYIEGSVALGASPARVILRHVLPNISGTLLTLSTLLFASTLLSASGLGFLGLGTQPPFPEWGTMLGESRSYIRSHPYLATFPGLFLAVSALAFNLLGDALRTIYDPTSSRSARRAPLFAFLRKRRGDVVMAPANGAAVDVSDLRMAFRTNAQPLEVVRGINLRIEPGRMLAVVGESGSGKSTLLRAIATLASPQEVEITSGAIAIGGEPALGLAPAALRALRRRKIGVVFQDAASALNPVLTVGDQIAEAVRGYGITDAKQIRERCLSLLRDVNIADPERRLGMYPHQFSGGMKQRIVIAIALAQNPEVLLADEPTSALDVTIQQQIMVLLRDIQRRRGMAVLLVTHDLGLVSRFADDVAVMYAGRIVESGDVGTVLTRPIHPYTIALRASAPSAAGAGRKQPLLSIPGEPPLIGRLPEGCSFQPRCPRSAGRTECHAHEPPVRPVAGRSVACVFAEEALA